MSKYAPLAEFLGKRRDVYVRLSFSDVEKVLGFKLPSSAYTQRAWWSNNADNNVMTRVWKKAGYRSEAVDMAKQKVVFRNTKAPLSVGTLEESIQEDRRRSGERRGKTAHHPLRGALKGTLMLVGGTDLTKPADPDWATK